MKNMFLVMLAILPLAYAQNPLQNSIPTPRPVDPSSNTTNPSALAVQSQNPYLGSTPSGTASIQPLALTLQAAIHLGLKYNLGLIDSAQGSAQARAQRMRALSQLLPEITARASASFEQLSLAQLGVKFPGLPAVSGPFSYQEAGLSMSQSLFNQQLRNNYRGSAEANAASVASLKDSRDVVVAAVGLAYLQLAASEARLRTAQAQLASAAELEQQTADRVRREVSPEIDSLRAQVEAETARQRVTGADNDVRKNRLTVARLIGLPNGQKLTTAEDVPFRPITDVTEDGAIETALASRSDLVSAQAMLRAADFSLKAQKSERLPEANVTAGYGGGGINVANLHQVFAVTGSISVPIYTGGRIRADIEEASALVTRRRAEVGDLEGRIRYDVQIALLDVAASESSVHVAERNQVLADRALTQARDRFEAGVTNYLEVVQAREALVAAQENYINSVFSHNASKLALARAMGVAEERINQFLGGN